MGDWSTGKGNLKACIGASKGSWRVGAINKCRVFLIGTGGSVSSDQAKDVFMTPQAYDLVGLDDFGPKKHSIFIPADYLMGGMGWEEHAVNNNEKSKKFLEDEREATKDDMEIHTKLIQEYPLLLEEVFRKSGTNTFNQRKIGEQWTKLNYEWKDHKPKKGFLEWERVSPGGPIKGVKFSENPEGNIEITEEPFRGEGGDKHYPNAYVIGVDGIDQGNLDSTSIKNRSSLAALVKKRIISGQFFQQTSNMYVAKYLGRSDDVRDDYEEVLKLAVYYGEAKVNLEYTKIGMVDYFRHHNKFHLLMKRPMAVMPSGGDGIEKRFGIESKTNLIGTPATNDAIVHMDGKIKEYINDHSHNILFLDLLEQLRDYQPTDRTRYD